MIKFLIALILFLPTTCLTGSYIYVLFIPIGLFFYRNELLNAITAFYENPFKRQYLLSFWLIVVLLIGIGVNSLIGSNFVHFIKRGTLLLIPLTILSAYMISDQKVYRFLLIFIVVEVCVGILEYVIGVNTFFSSLPKHHVFNNYVSLYKTRVFGLSANSTYLAQKCLIGILLLYFVDLNLKTRHVIGLFLFLMTGVILTFGRTVVVSVLVCFGFYFLTYLYNHFRDLKHLKINMNKSLLISSILFSLVILSTFSFWSNQFNRMGLRPHENKNTQGAKVLEASGIGKVEMAGRRELWGKAIDFIFENPVYGNHSQRFLVNNKHVHNSLLEYLSTHGLILLIVILAFIIFNLNGFNIAFCGGIMLYSLGQFGIFWDISFLDILFMSILLFSTRVTNSNRYEKDI